MVALVILVMVLIFMLSLISNKFGKGFSEGNFTATHVRHKKV